MAKTTLERIAEAQEKINRDENKLKLLMRQQKEEDRKARTNRICKRVGLLEKLLPDTINLTDGQFEAFAKRTLRTDFTRRALAAAETADPQGKADTARGGETPAPKSADAAPAGGAPEAAKADRNGLTPLREQWGAAELIKSEYNGETHDYTRKYSTTARGRAITPKSPASKQRRRCSTSCKKTASAI